MSEPVKCVVWDLDDTLWEGTLVEGDRVVVPDRHREFVRLLDQRGVLQSVASRNDPEPTLAELARQGLAEYFLHPQVGWQAKSESLRLIAKQLNIATASLLFVDDSDFERAEVASALPEVRCVSPSRFAELLEGGDVLPAAVTPEAAQRRQLYLAEQRRGVEQANFTGPAEEFLRSLRMRLTVRDATAQDLARAAELTQRTHQLNTTGLTFGERELAELAEDPGHRVLVATLTDRFGGYGTIGLAVVATSGPMWTIRLLLMSCRVMGRNIGTAFVGVVVGLARARGAGVRAHFRPTDRNRQMRMTYRFLGFTPVATQDDLVVFELPGSVDLQVPDYVHLDVPADLGELLLTTANASEEIR
ncbi:HAD-IIIC family phosphatase [Saccharothrix coeruleofusca]|uniref:N-acetyltransferase domain-containing protein n=1 Tax=Saccharothrix coeruleofusca TaxID=33919 RepID=A0A918AR63_9PSEU|nr:HAD-IIIC family phosphatase [Saccharothrix coeruleofusca]GGP76079.1 hypothetical protein GCM10010185_57150 [Saccharothrix coeruleofusca]